MSQKKMTLREFILSTRFDPTIRPTRRELEIRLNRPFEEAEAILAEGFQEGLPEETPEETPLQA